MIRVALLTISDRCSTGEREDISGKTLRNAVVALGWSVIEVARGLQASGVDALTAVVESIFLNAQIILIFLLGVGMLVGGGYGLGEALSG